MILNGLHQEACYTFEMVFLLMRSQPVFQLVALAMRFIFTCLGCHNQFSKVALQKCAQVTLFVLKKSYTIFCRTYGTVIKKSSYTTYFTKVSKISEVYASYATYFTKLKLHHIFKNKIQFFHNF